MPSLLPSFFMQIKPNCHHLAGQKVILLLLGVLTFLQVKEDKKHSGKPVKGEAQLQG
jgi:hypothetical protein